MTFICLFLHSSLAAQSSPGRKRKGEYPPHPIFPLAGADAEWDPTTLRCFQAWWWDVHVWAGKPGKGTVAFSLPGDADVVIRVAGQSPNEDK